MSIDSLSFDEENISNISFKGINSNTYSIHEIKSESKEHISNLSYNFDISKENSKNSAFDFKDFESYSILNFDIYSKIIENWKSSEIKGQEKKMKKCHHIF